MALPLVPGCQAPIMLQDILSLKLGHSAIPCTFCLQLNDKLIDGRAIPYEYERLCAATLESNRSMAYSMSSLEIMKRNRYTDVLPFDESRVLLEGLDCDYINASILTSR